MQCLNIHYTVWISIDAISEESLKECILKIKNTLRNAELGIATCNTLTMNYDEYQHIKFIGNDDEEAGEVEGGGNRRLKQFTSDRSSLCGAASSIEGDAAHEVDRSAD